MTQVWWHVSACICPFFFYLRHTTVYQLYTALSDMPLNCCYRAISLRLRPGQCDMHWNWKIIISITVSSLQVPFGMFQCWRGIISQSDARIRNVNKLYFLWLKQFQVLINIHYEEWAEPDVVFFVCLTFDRSADKLWKNNVIKATYRITVSLASKRIKRLEIGRLDINTMGQSTSNLFNHLTSHT